MEAEKEADSAPPRRFRVDTVIYPVPSVLPTSVPDLSMSRGRSVTVKVTSSAVGSEGVSRGAKEGGGASRAMDMFGWKISTVLET